MAKQTINIGASANDSGAESLRSALDKVNDNFTEVYGAAGSWTPSLKGGATAGAPTYASRGGYYLRRERLVIAWFALQLSSVGGMTGGVLLAPLPVAPSDNFAIGFAGSMSLFDGVTLSSGVTLGVRARGGSNDDAQFITMGDGASAGTLQASELANDARLQGVLIYECEAL